MKSRKSSWFVYIIRCGDLSLYTGIATDVDRRFAEHESQGAKAAKYLRGATPLDLALSTGNWKPLGGQQSRITDQVVESEREIGVNQGAEMSEF